MSLRRLFWYVLIYIVASKFFEHFILISDAMTFRSGDQDASLWNEEDGYAMYLLLSN